MADSLSCGHLAANLETISIGTGETDSYCNFCLQIANETRALRERVEALERTVLWLLEVATSSNPDWPLWLDSNDLLGQISTWRCFGCGAVGTSSYPKWEIQITHDVNCKVAAARKLLEHK